MNGLAALAGRLDNLAAACTPVDDYYLSNDNDPNASEADVRHVSLDLSWDMGWGFGHMAFGGLMMLLFWGAVIAVVVIAVQRLGGGSPGTRTQPSDKRALDILQQRFARGEIEKEEFEERRRLLSD